MIEKIFPKEFFKDGRLLILAGALAFGSIITIVRVLLDVRQYDYKVTVGYTQYGADSFELGEWYSLYEPAIFTFITSLVALLIAMRLFNIDRKMSYVIILMQYVILLFTFIVSGALLGASSIVS